MQLRFNRCGVAGGPEPHHRRLLLCLLLFFFYIFLFIFAFSLAVWRSLLLLCSCCNEYSTVEADTRVYYGVAPQDRRDPLISHDRILFLWVYSFTKDIINTKKMKVEQIPSFFCGVPLACVSAPAETAGVSILLEWLKTFVVSPQILVY